MTAYPQRFSCPPFLLASVFASEKWDHVGVSKCSGGRTELSSGDELPRGKGWGQPRGALRSQRPVPVCAGMKMWSKGQRGW